jgi:disulfide bond formation protein DsbB
MTEFVTSFLALLAVGVQVVLAAALVLALLALVSRRGRAYATRARRALAGTELVLAGIVAVVATLGSLYFSEVANFVPCVLCWYQRIAMYPLALLLPLAVLLRRTDVGALLLPLPVIGGAIAVYHYQLEWFPHQSEPFCSQGVPCSVRWFLELGYVSLPLLSLTAFTAIAALLTLSLRRP